MAQTRNSSSHGLQQLIDSYNEEIMRYSRLASPEQHMEEPDAAMEAYRQTAEKELAERQREESEFEAERGRTEQSYWLGKGKYGIIRNGADENAAVPAEAEDTKGGTDPIERVHYAGSESEYADEASYPEDSPQKQWLADVRQGLLELKRGLEELAQGQRELREGLLDYLRGIAERDQWVGQNGQHTQHGADGNDDADNGYDHSGGWGFGGGEAIPSANPVHNDNSFQPPEGPVPANVPDSPPAQSPYSIPSDGTGFGMFQASVYTARRAVPVPGALVTVFSGGAPYATYLTDIDGKTPVVQLPAGTASSQDESYAAPYVNYQVTVTADGYYPQNDLTAQIFSGQTAFLPVEMVPLPDGA